MEMKSQTEKENKDTNIMQTHAESHHSQVASTFALFSRIPPSKSHLRDQSYWQN
jgi:hypothetical protein